MKLSHNREVILRMIEKKPELGKTAVMKMVFILQYVYKMKLGYSFDIYTYGPYTAEVSDDLDSLICGRFIDAETYPYNNTLCYVFTANKKLKDLKSTLSPDDEQKISTVLKLFGDKKAKELELDSTIIYMKNSYVKNGWGDTKADIIKDVNEIKPHFSLDNIGRAYDILEKNNMLA